MSVGSDIGRLSTVYSDAPKLAPMSFQGPIQCFVST
jgi:hypothetical protein